MTSIIVLSIVIIFLIISLFREWFQPAISFLIAILILGLFNILDGSEMLVGFSDPQILSILLLIVFGNLLGDSSILDVLFSRVFEQVKTFRGFVSRLLPSVIVVSAFMNNTPIVALLIPHVYKWSKQSNVTISKLLIPLSYSAILGGTITLVGTSTNMLVNAYAMKNSEVLFSIFDFAWVGIPVSIIGFLYMLFFGQKILPERKTLTETVTKNSREYIVEAEIDFDSEYVGKTIREANLRKLNGLFVVEILRKGESITPVSPNERLQANDTLILAGNVEAISDLIDLNNGLSIPESNATESPLFDLVEVVVSQGSYLVNQKVKDSDFRSRYDASVVAINRRGAYLKGKLGDQILHAGDTLVLLAGKDFSRKIASDIDFYQISTLKEIRPLDVKQSMVVGIGLLLSILLSALGVISLFKSLLALLLVCLLSRILSYSKLNRYLDYNLLIIAALALSLGIAADKTGLSYKIAHAMLSFSKPFGIVGALVMIYMLAFTFTELMTNIAAASLALPFGLSIATQLGVSPEPFFLAIAYAASASFITPMGYQTNLMVYGPGGYKFSDFLVFGLPLTILYMVVAISIIYFRFF